MKKKIQVLTTLLLTGLISLLGFTSCGSQKKALEEKQRQEEAARREAEEEARRTEQARIKEQERLAKEAARRRAELERQKLVYGPPTTDFRPDIDR